ncbi:hypothetical protein NECAME_12959 [Necator americanus]|uniref:Uncharacterized protein n=1 Tax=Necator americanus TaxID=51031 RepID=W2SXH9_NECAM|nr:hypothetical protein NECAME_12959 [Necator americanus]ETN74459.1 hypothetical protein NECAME_12959 [Necator americanus]
MSTSKRIPRSLSAPVFRKTSRRLVNVLLFKLRDMRIATAASVEHWFPPPPVDGHTSAELVFSSWNAFRIITLLFTDW